MAAKRKQSQSVGLVHSVSVESPRHSGIISPVVFEINMVGDCQDLLDWCTQFLLNHESLNKQGYLLKDHHESINILLCCFFK